MQQRDQREFEMSHSNQRRTGIDAPSTAETVAASAARPQGRQPVVRNAIARFVADVADLSVEATRERWKAEIEAVLDTYEVETRKVYVSRYRAGLVKALGPAHRSLGIVTARGMTGPATRTASPSPPISRESKTVGRPSVLRDAVASFAASLPGVRDQSQMQTLWDEELAKHEGKAERSIKLYVGQYYRPAIIAAFGGDHPYLSIVKPPDGMVDRIRAKDRARVAQSHRNLVEVRDWREIVARGTRLLRSREPVALAAGLLCVTGRRPYEVFCTGDMAPATIPGGARRAASRWSVMFDGQAKTKNRPGTRQAAYEIPVLAEARLVLAAFEELRASPEGQEWAGLDNREFSRLTTGSGADERIALAETVEGVFGGLWPEENRLTPRSLRALYAEVAYKHFGTPAVSKNSYFAAVLGHTMKDLETSLSYMDYYLGDDARAQSVSASLAGRFAEAELARGAPAPEDAAILVADDK